MASKAEKSPSSLSEAPLAAFTQLQEAGLGNMLGMSSAWIETMGDMGAEVASFVADRIKEDVKTQHEILHCKNMTELQAIQTEFVQKALDQYQAETGKLVEMGTKTFAANLKDQNSKS
ncbi:phasin family protein [uncultured Roseobacter sp.]|uniref:phasin family protein n=1 Tax=uncultured Roseobacter sp. TaxID=114847 RepID=UPI0026316ABF|nr:phasin family protein [uncultured Roseobacter sp.]